jgi:phosphoserine aminotransferase
VIDEAEQNIRALLEVPATHEIVFCQGGATQQFSMVAMNFLRGGSSSAEYVVTGAWGAKAVKEARKEGDVRVAWSGESDGFTHVPSTGELGDALSASAAYAHVTTNETIQGVEFLGDPSIPDGVPLVADVSSDFLSRPVAVDRYALLYAGAQKNAGPAGVSVVIVRRDMLDRIPDGLPTMLDYRTFVEHGSLYNTPPVFSIYVLMLVTRWLRRDVGGLAAQHAINEEKAGLLYDAIDASDGFYRGHAAKDSRSRMNVTWRLPTDGLETAFVTSAADAGMVELKGHRSVGGVRASLYNAMPVAGVRALADFMNAFAEDHR